MSLSPYHHPLPTPRNVFPGALDVVWSCTIYVDMPLLAYPSPIPLSPSATKTSRYVSRCPRRRVVMHYIEYVVMHYIEYVDMHIAKCEPVGAVA